MFLLRLMTYRLSVVIMQICETEEELIDRVIEVGLTSSQEDYILEESRERYYENLELK